MCSRCDSGFIHVESWNDSFNFVEINSTEVFSDVGLRWVTPQKVKVGQVVLRGGTWQLETGHTLQYDNTIEFALSPQNRDTGSLFLSVTSFADCMTELCKKCPSSAIISTNPRLNVCPVCEPIHALITTAHWSTAVNVKPWFAPCCTQQYSKHPYAAQRPPSVPSQQSY